jgi:hypothetical protein
MTGQVKEELLTRLGEMGTFIERGALGFDPVLLRACEFITQETMFDFIDVNGQNQTIDLPPGSLAYTLCQVPIVYILSDDDRVEIAYANGHRQQLVGNRLDAEASRHVFCRDGHIERITVYTTAQPH